MMAGQIRDIGVLKWKDEQAAGLVALTQLEALRITDSTIKDSTFESILEKNSTHISKLHLSRVYNTTVSL